MIKGEQMIIRIKFVEKHLNKVGERWEEDHRMEAYLYRFTHEREGGGIIS